MLRIESLVNKILRYISIYLLAFAFIMIGVLHFTDPSGFLDIMPPQLPWPLVLVYISGFFEIIGGIGLALPWTRRWASYGLVALLIAVYPANIHMWWNNVPMNGVTFPSWAHAFRLSFQFVLIAWVLWAGQSFIKGAGKPSQRPVDTGGSETL